MVKKKGPNFEIRLEAPKKFGPALERQMAASERLKEKEKKEMG